VFHVGSVACLLRAQLQPIRARYGLEAAGQGLREEGALDLYPTMGYPDDTAMSRTSPRRLLRLAGATCTRLLPISLLLVAFTTGCAETSGAEFPPLGKKWFERAQASYRSGDFEDAAIAVEQALKTAGERPEVKLVAARVALANLEYDRVLQLLEGLTTTDARALRGRALWYAGEVERAADELEQLNSDPDVRDAWAVDVAKLARRGTGRKPFTMSGGLVAATDMPYAGGTSMLVPVELNGEPALGLIATGTAEAVVDGAPGAGSWISLRFGERIEVRDVPALSRDLSGISRQTGAPVKLLIGVNLLRHLNPTFDLAGGQFVVRSYEPPPPPSATTVKLGYVRGGGMVMRAALGSEDDPEWMSLLIDTSMGFPVALDADGWKKTGLAPSSLVSVPRSKNLKQGILSSLRVGAFQLPEVPAVHGTPMDDLEKALDMDLDGMVGSALLAAFRVTLADRGLTMWLEPMPGQAVGGEAARDGAPIP
jgi:tetratricopeptide (TPR) repeat protein